MRSWCILWGGLSVIHRNFSCENDQVHCLCKRSKKL
jgi:hypothetical protein